MESARFCNQCGQPVQALPGPGQGVILAPQDFEHPSMQQMNQMLRRSVVLRKMAETVSRKIGKPWYESSFNSILASEKQYPRVHEMSRVAARRLGLSQVPPVYVEMDRGYLSSTYGSERDSFVNVGTFMLRLLNDRELLFVLGHEFGHLASHHALWTTVSMFLVGQQRSNLMADGLMAYVSNPLKIIEGGVESVITSWMRVADLTADRAALLAVGDFDIAARTLFLLHLKSRKELDELDLEAWMRQQESQDATMVKISQLTTSATPYLGLRLKELKAFHGSARYRDLQRRVDAGFGPGLNGLFDANGFLNKPGDGTPGASGRPEPVKKTAAAEAKVLTGQCPKCRAGLKLRIGGAAGREPAEVTCSRCGHVFSLNIPRIFGRAPAPPEMPARPAPPRKVRMVNGRCPRCHAPFAVPLASLPDKPRADLRCRGCGRTFRLPLGALKEPPSQEMDDSGLDE